MVLVEMIFVLHISRQSNTNDVHRAGSWTRRIYFGMFNCFKMDSIWERILCIHQNIRILEGISFLFHRPDPNLSVGVLIETDGYPSFLSSSHFGILIMRRSAMRIENGSVGLDADDSLGFQGV